MFKLTISSMVINLMIKTSYELMHGRNTIKGILTYIL